MGSARNCGAVSTVTPPVGQNATSANGPEKAFSSGMPPTAVAGNSFRKVKPSSAAIMISLPVDTPGSSAMSSDLQASPITRV